MTRSQQYARRKAMADAVAKGSSVETVARRRNVTVFTVKAACREHGVSYPGMRKSKE